MTSILLVGLCLPTISAQQVRQRKPALRRSVSFPTSPTPTTSFYPVMRNTAAQRTSPAQKPGGWVDLGNGARMRLAKDSAKDTSNSELSPDVLQTLRNLKEQEPKPRYQLNPTPITGAVSQPLEGPTAEREEQQEIGATESKITFPPEKNIRIQALDFRNTSVTDALRSLAQLIRINLMLSPGITGNVTILFSDVTLEEAFNTLLTSYDLSFTWEGNILRIFPRSDAPLRTKIFPIQHTNANDIKTIVDRMLTENRGSSEVDARTNSLMVTDTSTKLAEIKSLLPQIDVKESSVDISSRPLTEVFYLDYADATSLRAPIEMLSNNVQIQEFSSSSASQAGAAGGETGGRMDMMIITDTQNNLQRIRELIEKLDVAPIQVTIDAHIYEIDKNEEERLGINWQKSIPIPGTEANIFEMTIAPESTDAGGTGVFRFGSLDINQFTALLAMLKTHSFAKVLSNPVITTLNNRQANITVGQSIPYISASQVNAQTGQVTNTIAQANANIALVVTPSVTGNDEIFLDIQPTISSVLGFSELGGNSTPNLSTRSAVTQVICKNNHTIVIGGMIKTDQSETISKVPFLGDLPGIGKLFQKKTNREVRTELIIFITPHIVSRDPNKARRATLSTSELTAPRLTLQP
jgi:type II secretory pathway component GspD/PulD (secretin)